MIIVSPPVQLFEIWSSTGLLLDNSIRPKNFQIVCSCQVKGFEVHIQTEIPLAPIKAPQVQIHRLATAWAHSKLFPHWLRVEET